MSQDLLPIDFIISAQIRVAAREGIPIVVRRKGDAVNGTMVIKINLLDGTSKVYSQIRYGDDLVWCPARSQEILSETEAEQHMESHANIDPDSWLIEVEDKQGRLWFPGKIMTL